MRENGSVSAARLRFKDAAEGEKAQQSGNDKVVQDPDGEWFLHVPGIAINDHFQVLDVFGAYNDRIYIMAVPYIGGFNPDYSGLDFCEAASMRIVQSLLPTEVAEDATLPISPPSPA